MFICRMFWVVFFSCFFGANIALAHRPGESYIFLNVSKTEVTGRFETTLEHLNKVLPLDVNNDNKIDKDEFFQAKELIKQTMQNTLMFYQGEQTHKIHITGYDEKTRDTKFGQFVLLHFTIPTLNGVPKGLQTDYHFLFDDIDDTHRGVVVLENNILTGVKDKESNIVAILGPDDSRKFVRFTPLAWYEVVIEFIKHGAWHIWIGFDHILFIISLLLPSVMLVKERQYQPVEKFGQAMWAVVAIITLFTISHSISLSLATLDVVRLPARFVESLIAASIAVSAVNNIYPIYSKKMGVVVFVFGLFHGFGFANVLAPLDLQESSLLSSLFGFNVGVELGQLAIILAVFPLLYWLRNWKWYNWVILRLGSIGLIGISMLWFIKRAFGL